MGDSVISKSTIVGGLFKRQSIDDTVLIIVVKTNDEVIYRGAVAESSYGRFTHLISVQIDCLEEKPYWYIIASTGTSLLTWIFIPVHTLRS